MQFRSAWHQISTLLKEYPAPKSSDCRVQKGGISVESIFAAAPGQHAPLLRKYLIQLEKGEVLGIIGPSASGKTSLAKLLVGVTEPLSGKVRLDGADICQWDKELPVHLSVISRKDVELMAASRKISPVLQKTTANLSSLPQLWLAYMT